MKERVLIVDGHSMIFQWPDLRALHARNGATARQQLVQALTRYQDNTGTTVIAVFDGKGAKTTHDETETGIKVFYSKSGQTADSVIERLVATYAQKFEMLVATDDHLERTTVESFGAAWMSSEVLAAELRGADSELEERISRLRKR